MYASCNSQGLSETSHLLMDQGSSSKRTQVEYTFAASKELGWTGRPAIGSTCKAWQIMTLKPGLSNRSLAQKRKPKRSSRSIDICFKQLYEYMHMYTAIGRYVYRGTDRCTSHSHVLPSPSAHALWGQRSRCSAATGYLDPGQSTREAGGDPQDVRSSHVDFPHLELTYPPRSISRSSNARFRSVQASTCIMFLVFTVGKSR